MRIPKAGCDYPLHIDGDRSKGEYRISTDAVPYFPCRTYDADGNLIKEETREPYRYESPSQALKVFDVIYGSCSEPDIGGKWKR